MSDDCERLRSFFDGSGRDDAGRTVEEVLAFDDQALERHHDFIQWLFPIDTKSAFQTRAPVLNAACARQLRDEPSVRRHLRRALVRMGRFYGFTVTWPNDEASPEIRRSPEFAARAAEWVRSGDHNFLRISRVLRSLVLLGCAGAASRLYSELLEVNRWRPGVVGEVTLAYWGKAARGDPDPSTGQAR